MKKQTIANDYEIKKQISKEWGVSIGYIESLVNRGYSLDQVRLKLEAEEEEASLAEYPLDNDGNSFSGAGYEHFIANL